MIYYIGPEFLIKEEKNKQGIVNSTIEECVEYCKTKKQLAVDTETEGFFDFSNKVIMFQIGDEEKQFVIDTRLYSIEPLREILESENIQKLLWNAKFDYKFIKHCFNITLKNVYDGFLVECILTNGKENRTLSLGGVSERDLGITLDKEERNKFSTVDGEPFTFRQIVYGAGDVEHLPKLKAIQEEKIKAFNFDNVVRLENKFVLVLADIELNGFYLDAQKWLAINQSNQVKVEEIRNEIDKYIVDNKVKGYVNLNGDLFNNGKPEALTWRTNSSGKYSFIFSSSAESVKFFKKLGVDTRVVDKKTGKVKHSVEAPVLLKSIKKCDFIPLYLKFKEVEKEISTYGREFINHINPITGRVHSNFWQILNTGRISSNDPNLQNIPAGIHRYCFTPQSEDKTLIVADYSQQEPRITADKCNDPSLVEFFLTGHGDMHSFVTSRMYSVIEGKEINIPPKVDGDDEAMALHKAHPYAKHRQKGKVLNLKLDYGGSAFTVKDDLGVDEQEAEYFITVLKQAFPKKEEYFNRVIKNALKNGYVLIDNKTQRKWFIPFFEEYLQLKRTLTSEFWDAYKNPDFKKANREIVSKFYKLKGKIERNSKNFPIQGTAGSMTKLAGILIRKRFEEEGLDKTALIVNMVHDEIVCECLKDDSQIVSRIMKECMEQAGKYFCPIVPQKTNPVVSDKWMH